MSTALGSEDEAKLKRAEQYFKRRAATRNARATAQLLQIVNFFTFVTVVAIKTIETTLDRFSDQTLYSVVITVIVGGVNVAYLLVTFAIDYCNIPEIYDSVLRDNNVKQRIVYLLVVPLISTLFIATRWSLYERSGNRSSFHVNADDSTAAIIYTYGSLLEWGFAVVNSALIFVSLASFTRSHDQEYNYYGERGIRWSKRVGEFIVPKYLPQENMTVLAAGPYTDIKKATQ